MTSRTGLNAGRYEFWLYRQIRKRVQAGEFHLNDSLRHLSDERVPEGEQASVLAEMNIPFLQKPIKKQRNALASELHRQWKAYNRELKQGKLKHREYDKETQKLTWHKSVVSRHKAQEKRFYEQLSFCDVTDVFRVANHQCRFLPAMKQPDGGHRCSGNESWPSCDGTNQRYSVSCAGNHL